MQRIADRDYLVAGIHRAGADRRDILLLEFLCPLQERKVVFSSAETTRNLTGACPTRLPWIRRHSRRRRDYW